MLGYSGKSLITIVVAVVIYFTDTLIQLSCMDSSKEHHLVRSFHKTKYEDNEAIGGFVGRIERVRSALEVSSQACNTAAHF